MHLLITGADGQLGSALRRLLDDGPHTADYTDRAQLDLTDPAAVSTYVAAESPAAVVNCAAYTAVDRAETDDGLARAINDTAVGVLAKACHRAGAALVQVSTDYVYHNGFDRPLREDDPTTPQSVYAQTKLDGERAALEACAKTIVLRTSWVYGLEGHNFLRTMLRLGRERDGLSVVSDQIGAPTFADDLAAACLHAADGLTAGQLSPGIYNYAGEGVGSWYDFAHAILGEFGVDCDVRPIPTSDYPTPAERPPYSVLDLTKARAAGFATRHWRDALREFRARDTTEA